MYWQQAWGSKLVDNVYQPGQALRNANHIRTPKNGVANTNTYVWALNALSIRAAGRFQLPNIDTSTTPDDGNPSMGWKSPVAATDYDLADGEVYYDAEQKSVLGRATSQWYQFAQPDRFESVTGTFTWDGARAKNLLCESSSAFDLTLRTDLNLVPRGSLVRVFNLGTGTVTVKVGASTLETLAGGTMGEFLFYVTTGLPATGTWIVTQAKLATTKLP